MAGELGCRSIDSADGFDERGDADHSRCDGVGGVEQDERAALVVGGGELVDALANLLALGGLHEQAIGCGGRQEQYGSFHVRGGRCCNGCRRGCCRRCDGLDRHRDLDGLFLLISTCRCCFRRIHHGRCCLVALGNEVFLQFGNAGLHTTALAFQVLEALEEFLKVLLGDVVVAFVIEKSHIIGACGAG